ncbi:hypothetical protein TNCV_127021 [Trichonephila clavipes]|nr:hypothetical protein TNCV_127021 [Trichonephila clavipes]
MGSQPQAIFSPTIDQSESSLSALNQVKFSVHFQVKKIALSHASRILSSQPIACMPLHRLQSATKHHAPHHRLSDMGLRTVISPDEQP